MLEHFFKSLVATVSDPYQCNRITDALAAAGIKLFGGVSGDADEAVNALINETLDYNPEVKCSHHEHNHEEGHACSEHGCGSHSCH